MPRNDGRAANEIRQVTMESGIAPHAAGSVLIAFGNTRVICAASIEEGVPRWMKEQGVTGGWLTAEYSMLPYSTQGRKPRDISKGKIDGRSSEIQRLIGRALRAAIDLEKLGARTLWVDCDVLQADGGTRTASITGACVAVELACLSLRDKLPGWPLKRRVAAISVGTVGGQPLLDLNYLEDRDAEVDLNLVMTETGEFVELQASGEEAVFTQESLQAMLDLGRQGICRLIDLQKAAVAG